MKCICGTKGWKVKKITLGNHLNPEYWHLLNEDFHFCPNPDCDVVYFSQKVSFTVKEVKTKVFFKEKGSPKPLCYCKQVTEEDVIEAINKGARSVEEVEKMTGIGNGGHCLITNPSGRCCKPNYTKFINEILEARTEPENIQAVTPETPSEDCCTPEK
ncbi:(2Fe-2S)-binding protein [Geoglobus acetivorans]|uniref:(2Fe-2S)-binding protein n=1 Tax=Geoglobus acetivorans TaxID=565033 RepID=A0ABZ3H129_GEOAI|nr:(2Fe-2S)-binding protein [Geoglobus acetivorans]